MSANRLARLLACLRPKLNQGGSHLQRGAVSGGVKSRLRLWMKDEKVDRKANIGASRVHATDVSLAESLRFGAHHHRDEHLGVLFTG